YKGKLYPKGASGIVAILFPVSNQNDTFTFTAQPQAVLVYNGKQDTLPLECVFIDGREIRFEEDGLGGCFVIIPRINDNTINPLGTGLYISEKNKNTLFYKMYLTNQKMEYFELVYNDEGEMPLSVYNGRVIGPLKIWNVTYPEDLEVPEIYYKDVLPNPAVENIKGRY
ncbi:MAG: hypothetical protein KKG75_04410, partial [Nanoarchaeota archaeon]|nr:hypothetical protein [Nanoarchaeota archaeon]